MSNNHDMHVDLVSLITLDTAKLNAEVVHADDGTNRALALMYRIGVQLDELRTDLRQTARQLDQEEVKRAEVREHAWDICEVCDGTGVKVTPQVVYEDECAPCACTGFLRFEGETE